MSSDPERLWQVCACLKHYLSKVPRGREEIAVRAIGDLLLERGAADVLEEADLVALAKIDIKHDLDDWLAAKPAPPAKATWSICSGLFQELERIMAEYEDIDG